MKIRKVHMARLRPEKLEEYKEYHRNVWPELQEAYRQAGITQISCLLNGTTLLVFSEFEEEIHAAARAALAENDAEKRWQALMRPMADPEFQPLTFEEVFYMPPSSAL